MIKLRDRKITIPGLFKSPPAYGNFVSICFESLCEQIAIANNIPNNSALKDSVDFYNAMRLAYGEKKVFCDEVVPSIRDQGNWKVHKVDSSKLMNGDFHYNSSILRHKGKLLFFYRLDVSGYAYICVCELDENYVPIENTNKKIELPEMKREITKFEDGRVFLYNNKIHLGACRWAGKWTMYNEKKAEIIDVPHQILVELDDNFNVTKEYNLDYGGNGTEEWQKNWVYFVKDNIIHMVYSHSPLIICQITDNGVKEVCNKKWNCRFNEQIKGGGCPIKVKDKWYSIAHSHESRYSNLATGVSRRYNVLAVTFDDDFNVRDFALPFMKASERDAHLPWTPQCIFPGSYIYENGEWIIAAGYQDWYSLIIEIEHSELLKYLRPVSS